MGLWLAFILSTKFSGTRQGSCILRQCLKGGYRYCGKWVLPGLVFSVIGLLIILGTEEELFH